jgi:hypothetical protein
MKQNIAWFCLLFMVLAATCVNCGPSTRIKSNSFRSILTRWSYRIGNKSQETRKENQVERAAANKHEKQEEERRMNFRNNLESHLVASAILRDFYAGRFK